MTLETLSSPIAAARAAHIRTLTDAARGVIAEHGVTAAALDAIAAELIALGLRRELFPAEHFPLPPNGSAIFRLAEDSDGRFALYLSAKPPGDPVPPHNHTTWAVIAGVQGAEHNAVYDRAPTAEPQRETLTPQFERTVTRIDRATLDRFRAEADARSLYILDVRTPEEFRAGHLPGSRSAPGGQLVQATDAYVGTLRSRIVLVDGEDVRAPVTASWLIQLGWPEVYVLDAGLSGALETGPEPRSVPLLGELRPDWIAPADLAALPGAVVYDIDNGRDFRTAHIAGAWFATRAALVATAAEHASADTRIVVTSRDGVLAAFGAAELAAAGHADVRVLLGGTEAWRAAGLPLESGARRVLSQGDTWLAPAQVAPEERDAEKRRYIAWELGLPEQIARDGDARFRVLRPQ